MFQRNLPESFHPVLLGKDANKVLIDNQYAEVDELTSRAIPGVKGVMPVRFSRRVTQLCPSARLIGAKGRISLALLHSLKFYVKARS